MSKFLTLNATNVKSAVVSGLLTALLAMAMYVIGLGDVFAINTKEITNIGAMALITSIVSLLKSLLTTDDGKFMGSVEVK